ncbi:hypothetical protein [Roseobacter sp. EG26]|uniref:hypothetical protein n=1 Tax=Roseobacter sp. EG26 TaxID=3412477 RepID=UPI003CE526C4
MTKAFFTGDKHSLYYIYKSEGNKWTNLMSASDIVGVVPNFSGGPVAFLCAAMCFLLSGMTVYLQSQAIYYFDPSLLRWVVNLDSLIFTAFGITFIFISIAFVVKNLEWQEK